MPSDYTVTVNVFDGSFTGHVNITLTGPDGWSYTFGNNTIDGSWGVRREFNEGRTEMFSTSYPVSYGQLMSMYNWVSGILNDAGGSYGLLGRNCVDFVRDMFETAGLGSQISHMLQWLDSPVNHYAAITDWLENNGFGAIWDGIGAVLGGAGEIASALINMASDAWGGLGDLVNSSYDFISGIGSSIGGFFGDLASDISNFFAQFGKGEPVGDGDMETVEGATTSHGDDFVLETSVMAMVQSDLSSMPNAPVWEVSWGAVASNDSHDAQIIAPLIEAEYNHSDYVFA